MTHQVPVRITRFAATQWVAAVTFGGRIIASPKSRTRKAAVAAMEQALRETGYTRAMPEWNLLPTEEPAPQPEAPVAPAPKPEAPAPVPTAKDVRDDAADAAIEAAKRSVIPTALPRMEGGVVTPRSDLAAWLDVFEQVCEKLEPVFEQDPDRRNRTRNFRDAVDLAMREISFRGAYERTIGGDFWLRHAQSMAKQAGRIVIDPTTRAPSRGEGNRRARHHRNINGNWDDVSSQTEAKVARKAAETRAAIPDAPTTPEVVEAARRAKAAAKAAPVAPAVALGDYVRDEESQTWRHRETGAIPRRAVRSELNKAVARADRATAGPRYSGCKVAYRAAYSYGAAMGRAYEAAGLKRSLGYKVGMIIALRGQEALPHPEYDALVEREIGAEKLAELVAQFRAQDALSA